MQILQDLYTLLQSCPHTRYRLLRLWFKVKIFGVESGNFAFHTLARLTLLALQIVLTVRDEDSWYKSFKAQVEKLKENTTYTMVQYFTKTGRELFSMTKKMGTSTFYLYSSAEVGKPWHACRTWHASTSIRHVSEASETRSFPLQIKK